EGAAQRGPLERLRGRIAGDEVLHVHPPAQAYAAQHDPPARSRHERASRGLEEDGVVHHYPTAPTSYTTSPPTTVATTGIFAISCDASRSGSAPRITRSPSLPTSNVPFTASSNAPRAAFTVTVESASRTAIRSGSFSTLPELVTRAAAHCTQ